MKRYTITVSGRTFDVQVLGDPTQDQVQVVVDGQTLTVDVSAGTGREDPISSEKPVATSPAPPPATGRPSSTTSARVVTAPLPGVIKSVDVKPGQQVTSGDELLVIEAMKMDNVLRATRDGIIETVHIGEGHRVDHGQPLVAYQE